MAVALQLVTLRWEAGRQEQKFILHHIPSDGRGRLDWAAVERSFHVEKVALAFGEPPMISREGAWRGFSMSFFKPARGSTIPVILLCRNAQGMDLLYIRLQARGVPLLETITSHVKFPADFLGWCTQQLVHLLRFVSCQGWALTPEAC